MARARITSALRLLSHEDVNAAANVLGSRHPLARSLALRRSLFVQLGTTFFAVSLACAGLAAHLPSAGLVLGASLLVALVLFGAAVLTTQVTRERARELIANAEEAYDLAPVRDERRRLASRRVRESLARALERHLRDAEHWYELLPQERPFGGIRALRHASHEAREVVARLRSDAARVRGVAAVARMLALDEGSPLLTGEVSRLRSELVHICHLLGGSPEPSLEAGAA
jgi:hypothetical protein